MNHARQRSSGEREDAVQDVLTPAMRPFAASSQTLARPISAPPSERGNRGKVVHMIFRQLFDPQSSTYTYLLADSATREAVLIDPVFEHARRDARADRRTRPEARCTRSRRTCTRTTSPAPGCSSAASARRSRCRRTSGAEGADRYLADGDIGGLRHAHARSARDARPHRRLPDATCSTTARWPSPATRC